MQRHLIRALLLSNADVEAQDNFGRTALMYAYLTGDIQLIRLFEVHGSSATGIETITLSRRVPRHNFCSEIALNNLPCIRLVVCSSTTLTSFISTGLIRVCPDPMSKSWTTMSVFTLVFVM
jgi:hypothetical protein